MSRNFGRRFPMSDLTQKAKDYCLTIWSRKIRLAVAILTAAILFAISFHYLYSGINKRFLMFTAISLLTGALLACPRPECRYVRFLLVLFYLILVPYKIYQRMEQPIHNMTEIQKDAIFWNLLIIVWVYALLLLVSQRVNLALGSGGIVLLFLFLLNYYHMQSHGSPFFFQDWKSLGMALPFLNGRQPAMSRELWYSILYFLFFIVLGFWCDIPSARNIKYHSCITGLSLAYILFFCFLRSPAYPAMPGQQTSRKTAWETELRYGYLLSLDSRIRNNSSQTDASWYEKFPVVCHAAGMTAEGIAGTNSKEALEYNYALGQRVFEVDIAIASDGVAVLRHDWDADLGQAEKLGLGQGTIPTSAEFLQSPIYGQYTPMALLDLYKIMSEREDMYVIIDPKYEKDVVGQFSIIVDTALDNGYESVLRRIVVQLYYEEMYDAVEAVYHFDNYLYTLYYIGYPGREKVEAFCTENQIPVVVMPCTWIDENICQDMAACSLRLYGHTVDDEEEARRLAFLGADGIYSDNLLPKDMREWLMQSSGQ